MRVPEICEDVGVWLCSGTSPQAEARVVEEFERLVRAGASVGNHIVSESRREAVSSWEDMAWTERQYSKGQIDRAGQALIDLPKEHPEREKAISIVDNWRSCHGYPLQIIKMTLLNRARKIDRNAL